MSSARFAAALAAALFGMVSVSGPAAACSVCLAGDPLFSKHGASAQREGEVSVYLQAQGWRKDSGLLPHGVEGEEAHHEGLEEGGEHEQGRERNRSQRLDLFFSWTPLDRVTLSLDVPYAVNAIEEIEAGASQTTRLHGLGDVALLGSFVLWRNRDVLPSFWIEGRTFLKAPTGRTTRREAGFVDPHLQTGTGSWDFGLGLAAVHRRAWGVLYTSVFYRENTEGDFGRVDYEYGDVLLANAALELPVGHALRRPSLDWLTLGAELNYRWSSFDRLDGRRFADSGGSILYATPALRFRLPFSLRERPASLRLALQLPLTQSWLHGSQDEKEVWTVGLLLPF